MTDKEVKTRMKLLPTLLRLFIGAMSLFLIVTAVNFSVKLIHDPTAFNFVSVLMFSFMGFFFMGLGPISIATFSTDGQTLTENIFGLFKKQTDLK